MDHASWIPRATFFEIAVYLKTCWHNDTIAYVGNVNIDLNIQAKDQFFPLCSHADAVMLLSCQDVHKTKHDDITSYVIFCLLVGL